MLALDTRRSFRTPSGIPCSKEYADALQLRRETERKQATAEIFEDWFRYSEYTKELFELEEHIEALQLEGHVYHG